MKKKILSNISKGFIALALAGTIFTSTGCVTFYSYKSETLEQKVTKKQQILEYKVVKKGKIGNLAVLLIDMQECFLKNIDYEERMREIPYQIEVLDYCKEKSVPVFVLEYKNKGPTTKVLKEKVDSLEKKVYVTKSYDDGFTCTDLAEQLKVYNINTLLLMGVNATACVVATAYGALNAGFNIMTSKDLIADQSGLGSEEGVRWYSTYGVHRDSYKDILDMISKGEVEITPPETNEPYIVFPEEPKKRNWKNPE